jgi:hypothetical protein
VKFCNTVFRVALYAATDIKAGKELFFNYNYPEEMTKNFKQPKGKVVAVKQVVAQPGKAKTKRARSRPSHDDDLTPNLAVKEALAKARAAKAAKRVAKQAGEVDQAPAIASNETASKPMQARKSASGPSSSKHASTTDARGQRSAVRNSNSREASTTSKSAAEVDDNTRGRNTVTPSLVVQDTDEDTNTDVENGAAADAPRRTSRPRAGMAKKSAGMAKKSAPTVAVKHSRKTFKRKRPIVVNSDDE